jgi:AcrR family transcriptional regulator
MPALEEKPYHHGNLRAALLTAAEQTLRERGVEQVSLRDLARQAGVSHGAPSRHFRDRQALLDALAAVGYTRLADALDAAIGNAGDDFGSRLEEAAATYVRFAVENGALLDLMLVTGKTKGPGGRPKPAGRPYLILQDLIRCGHAAGELRPGDPEHLLVLILATFQGIAALVSSHQVPADQTDALVAEAAALFTSA